MPSDDCFHCHKRGHWANRCPLKTPTKTITTTTTVTAASPPQIIQCPCDGGTCDVLTSKTEKNPNRKFYKCPQVPSCGFFKWCDQVNMKSELISVIPTCPCGSGPCRRVTVINGPNTHRSYLVCCIKKGFGACGFFQWENDASETEEAGRSGGSPCSTLTGFAEFDSADYENLPPENDLNLDGNVVKSSLRMVLSIEKGEEGNRIGEGSEQSVKDYSDTIPMNAVNTIGNKSVPVCLRLNKCVFASDYGSNKVYKDMVRVATEEQLLPLTPTKHIESQVETLCSNYPTNNAHGASEVVESTYVSCETDLSVNIIHPVSNHQSTTSADSEASFSSCFSLMELIEQYNSEKLRFESVSTKHAVALTAFTGSYKQLASARDRLHSLKKQLIEIEEQVNIYEAETVEFGASLEAVCGEMVKSQKKMVETAGKVAKEVRVLQAK